ncbi:hypothetical protein [Siphonobacter sp. SORGH_AS_0500]|uniref:hypothetical protein n=1 Tax=Siphonobacter sp. SORGH_AS_0500 TaxID=1864824 RepID=UPI0028559E6D|nr:hypothetical protein [Siphonobacter sp. SORGH_AS_0500]MDR6195917.1 hypothetical protein [Siphonobacter sp. SORGH_AS_0500]
MSKPPKKGSFLARNFPKLFSLINEKGVDQAQLAEIEQEADQALAAGIEAGLQGEGEDLEDPDTEASDDDDEQTKLKAEVARLTAENATLKTQNGKFKQSHKQQAAAGRALPKTDASTLGQQEQPQFAANSVMGLAMKVVGTKKQ